MTEKNRMAAILELILGVITILAGFLIVNEMATLAAPFGADATIVYLIVAFVILHGLKRIAENAKYIKK